MVKADVRTDYYAELGLPPNAEVEEIKKQFRKLAMKYHPDRNRGKELEFNSKFQAIQAAHEILTDPHQRLKYDTDRLRAGYGRVSGPPRPGPAPRQQPRKSNYPPDPPQRPHPATQHWSGSKPSGPYGQAPPPSAGAQKYAGYAKAGANKWDKAYDEARTRAEAYRGFQDMKNSRTTQGGWKSFDPRTGHPVPPGDRSEGTPRPRSHAQRPQSAYEAFFGKPPSSSTPGAQGGKKKDGFAPWTPGGDEPMAKNTSAYVHNTSRGERFQGYFEPAPSPTARKPPEQEPFPPNPERHSSRYASVGGEKTRVSGDGLGRATNASRKSPNESDSRSRTNPSSPTSPQSDHQTRHHSASPQFKPNRKQPPSPSAMSTSSSDTDEVLPNFRPKAVPRSRKSARNPPSMQPPNFGENIYGVAFSPDSWLLDESTGLPGRRKARGGPENWNWNANDEWSDLESRSSHPAQQFSNAFPKTSSPRYTQTKSGVNSQQDGSQWSDGGVNTKTSTLNGFGPESGNAYGGSLNNKPKSKSDESVGASFSMKEWTENFKNEFQFGDTSERMAAEEAIRRMAQTSSEPHAHPATTSSGLGEERKSRAGPADANSGQANPKFAETKFSADQWQDILNANTWSIPHSEVRQHPPSDYRRHRNPKKQPKATSKRPTVPQPASVSTEADEAEATYEPEGTSGNPQQTPSANPEVMDIDEDTPTTEPQEMPKAADQSTTKPQAKADSKNLFDLKNLESVAPFTVTNSSGIDDLNDLTSTLPFDSKPADNNVHASINIRPRDLALPNPPKAPSPNVSFITTKPGAPPERILTRTAWDQYTAEMGAYMFEWNDFNRKMLGHFNARQALVETGLSPNWMKAAGDSSKLNVNADGDTPENPGRSAAEMTDYDEQLALGEAKGGFRAYLRGVEEDFVVREHWSVAWERHRECILTLGRVREWIRSGGKIY